jgi:hypothetical protein
VEEETGYRIRTNTHGIIYADSIRNAVRLEGLFRGLGHNVEVETYDDATREWNTFNSVIATTYQER